MHVVGDQRFDGHRAQVGNRHRLIVIVSRRPSALIAILPRRVGVDATKMFFRQFGLGILRSE